MRKVSYVILALVLLVSSVIGVSFSVSAAPPAPPAYTPTQTIHVKPATLTQQDSYADIINCHFIINQIYDETYMPASITVYWSNSTSSVVNRDTTNPANKVAHYNAYPPAGTHATDATAVIYGDWDGEFNLSDISRLAPPVPELPAGILLAIGLVGVGGYILLRKRQQLIAR